MTKSSRPAIPPRGAGHCDDDAAWAKFVRQYDGQPRRLDMTDFALANRVFMADRNDLDLIVWQTAAKERIRWLSIELAKAQAALAEERMECAACAGSGKIEEATAEAGEDEETLAKVLARADGENPDADWFEVVGQPAPKMWQRYLPLARAALRDQPPAREDAQPVGWISEAALRLLSNPDGSEKIYGNHRAANYKDDALAVYTRPAPDALRVAVEALTAAMRVMTRIAATSSANLDQAITNIAEMREAALHGADAAAQALAALQAEQKGGA